MQVTKEVNEVIVGAIEYARENKHEYVTAEHILYKCTFIEKVQSMKNALFVIYARDGCVLNPKSWTV